MTILYIGPLQKGGTCLERMSTLGQLGYKVIPFDTSLFYEKKGKILQSLSSRLHIGPITSNINHRLMYLLMGNEFKSVKYIWVDKGVDIYYETLYELKKRNNAIAVHYTPDAQFIYQRSRHFFKSISIYDLLVTTKEWEVGLYKKSGAKNVMLVLQGYGEKFSPHKMHTKQSFKSDVCFIGHTQKDYAKKLKLISSMKIDLKVWGDGWPNYSLNNSWTRSAVFESGLWGEEYPIALSQTKIGLGFLGKHIPETSTTRQFEIPATGTFLLSERTELLQSLFKEGRDADFFSSNDEMIDKIDFYLRHTDIRKRIALSGLNRCKSSGYASIDILSSIMKKVEKIGEK